MRQNDQNDKISMNIKHDSVNACVSMICCRNEFSKLSNGERDDIAIVEFWGVELQGDVLVFKSVWDMHMFVHINVLS